MPRQSTPRTDIGYGWLRGEDWWGDPMSDNMVALDALLHPNITTMGLSQPPVDTLPGQQFIVGADAVAQWEGRENSVATRYLDRWRFVAAYKGLRVFIEDVDDFYWFNGESWVRERDGSAGVDPNGKAYDILCSVGYPPEPNEVVLLMPIPEPMTLPKRAIGSLATALAAPPVGTIVTIARNGSPVGTVMFPASAFAGQLNVANDVVFAPGDRLTVQMGNEVPGDFGNFAVLLRMMLPSE